MITTELLFKEYKEYHWNAFLIGLYKYMECTSGIQWTYTLMVL